MPKQVGDHLNLFLAVNAGKDRLSDEHLGEDAAHAPDVNGGRVLLPGEDELWRAVPSGGDVLGHDSSVALNFCAGEPEIADFEVTVAVHEDISGLEVAVEDTR